MLKLIKVTLGIIALPLIAIGVVVVCGIWFVEWVRVRIYATKHPTTKQLAALTNAPVDVQIKYSTSTWKCFKSACLGKPIKIELWAFTNAKNKHGVYVIELFKPLIALDGNAILATLRHELIHVDQMKRGDLVVGPVCRWSGCDWLLWKAPTDTLSMEVLKPWEIEANLGEFKSYLDNPSCDVCDFSDAHIGRWISILQIYQEYLVDFADDNAALLSSLKTRACSL